MATAPVPVPVAPEPAVFTSQKTLKPTLAPPPELMVQKHGHYE